MHSTFGAFRSLEALHELTEEENQAGWEVAEKADEYRVRFKRPKQVRRNDPMLPNSINPYRTL